MELYRLVEGSKAVYEKVTIKTAADKRAWEYWWDAKDRVVQCDCVNQVKVSTVFVGVGVGDNPGLYETRVFGGQHNDRAVLSACHAEAVKCHEVTLAGVRDSEGVTALEKLARKRRHAPWA